MSWWLSDAVFVTHCKRGLLLVCEMAPHDSPKRDINNRFGEFSFSLRPVYGRGFLPGFPSRPIICERRVSPLSRQNLDRFSPSPLLGRRKSRDSIQVLTCPVFLSADATDWATASGFRFLGFSSPPTAGLCTVLCDSVRFARIWTHNLLIRELCPRMHRYRWRLLRILVVFHYCVHNCSLT